MIFDEKHVLNGIQMQYYFALLHAESNHQELFSNASNVSKVF